MKAAKLILLASISAASLGLCGCDVFFGGQPRQQPVYVEQQPQYGDPQVQYIVAQQAPPPVIVEQRPAPPSASYIWIDGYWVWNNQKYNWQGGHYAVPPQAGVVWVAPRYDHDAHGYRYTPGQWKKQNEVQNQNQNQDNDHGRERVNN